MSGDVLAALDVGSNSAHLLVAEVLPAGDIRRVATRKTRLRLAEPVTREGRFGESLRHRVAEAVDDLLAYARRRGASAVAVVATDALRHADDGQLLRKTLDEELGTRLRVLEGLEEAALAFRGMTSALGLRDPRLGFDLGGGSLEIGYGVAGRLVAGASLPLGSARSTLRFAHDPPSLPEREALRAAALEQLRQAAADVLEPAGGHAPPALGTAGTIRDLGRLGLAQAGRGDVDRIRGLVVTREQLETAVARLVAVSAGARADLPGISGSRIDILPAGGVVLLAAMEAFALDRLQLCDWGLREGVVLDALDDEQVIARDDFTRL